MKKFIFTIIYAVFLSLAVQGQGYPFSDTCLSIEQRVEDLIGRLTLEEKLGFMVHQNKAVERLGIPPYSWWNEALHGVARNGKATVYPMPIAMAASFDTELVFNVYRDIAYEALTKHQEMMRLGRHEDYCGLTFFTPNINIFRDPRWGRGMETFGEDPFLTSRMGLAAVNGLQGMEKDKLLVGACIKHLAAHSGPEGLRHEWDSKVEGRDLWSTYLPAFEYIIRHSAVSQVMCAYNRINGAPCCANRMINEVLRRRWGYDGILVTDCWALNDMYERDTLIPRHETHATGALAAAAAFGTEVDLECGSGLPALRAAIDSGYIDEEKIDQHLRRILKVRIMVERNESHPIAQEKRSDETLRRITRESMVMLENNNILPLTRHLKTPLKKVAVIGPNAHNDTMQWGNYNGLPHRNTTILQGMQQLLGPKGVYYDEACHLVDDNYQLPKEFWNNLDSCDAVVFCGGLSPMLEGEELQVELPGFHRGDRTTIELPEVQRRLIKQIKATTHKPLILVLCTGSAIALEEIREEVDAILVGWYGGEMMGQVVADVVMNDVSRLGRLPLTFYKNSAQLPDFEDYSMQGRTYRYMEQEPRYPFGYGLTDGDFSFDLHHLQYSPKTHTLSGIVTDRNKAPRHTTEDAVVQIYARNLTDPYAPKLQLVAICRINVAAGESQHFEAIIPREAFYTYLEEEERMGDRGDRFELLVGFSSRNDDLKVVKIEEK